MPKEKPKAEGQQLFDQPLPGNLDAEAAVLGSILLMPEAMDEIAGLYADDFMDAKYAKLYRVIREMYDEGRKVDAVLIHDELKRRKLSDEITTADLAKLAKTVPHAAHIVYYANIVREDAILRSLIVGCTESIRDAYDRKEPAKALLNAAEQRVFALLESGESSKTETIKDVLCDSIERVQKLRRGELQEGGVKTGFDDFDSLTGGFHSGELVILAARPSMGKTAAAMNIACNIAFADQPVLFVSLEMTGLEVGTRILSSEGRIDGHLLRKGRLGQDEIQKLKTLYGNLCSKPLFIDDRPGRSVTDIASAARKVKRREGKLALIVVDYLQLIEPDDPRAPRQEQVARMTRRLKGLARELKVPILCLAQLNRQSEAGTDHRPKLSHLRESGAIEQDADMVMFVHREEYFMLPGPEREEKAGEAQFIVAKQRNGPIGDVNLVWSKSYTRFDTFAGRRHQEFDDFNDRASEVERDRPVYTGSFDPSRWDEGPTGDEF